MGASVPQEGAAAPSELEAWRAFHPVLTRMIGPWGGFHIFGSRLFMALLGVLALNIVACTATHWPFSKETATRTRMELAGFLLIHLAVLMVIAGGFISAGWRFDGRIVLIEGQSWTEGHDSYLALFEGPFRKHDHPGFGLSLDRIEQRFHGKDHLVELESHFLLPAPGGSSRRQTLKVNAPFTWRGLTITQDQVGFAPRLAITREADNAPIIDSFLALKRFSTPKGSEHRDVLPVRLHGGELIVTLFPSATWSNGVARKDSEAPDNPVVKLEYGAPSNTTPPIFLKLGDEAAMAGFRVRFLDWRRWSMYRIGADPGYPWVCAGLWLGLVSLAIRYGRLLTLWGVEAKSAASMSGMD